MQGQRLNLKWTMADVDFVVGLARAGRTADEIVERYAIRKRKAKADELRYMLSVTIPHSPEDAIRRAGC